MSTNSQETAPRSKRLREKQDGEQEDSSKRTRLVDENGEPKRWKVHQMAQEYVDFASNMMLHPLSNLGPYGYSSRRMTTTMENGDAQTSSSSYPLEHMSALGHLKSAVRRPSVIERWSPYEIAVFEAAMAEYGKQFYRIHKEIGSKSTKEVIEFYYIWKKTSHYSVWKAQYIPEYLDYSDEDEGGEKTPAKR